MGEKILNDAIERSQVLLLAVSDSAIEPLAQQFPKNTRVHFSGALVTPHALGAHPLMTFSENLYTLETYCKIPFILEQGQTTFGEIFPQLNNPHYFINPKQKALYHALCVMSGNFSTLLWSRAFEDFPRELGLPPEVLLPYLNQLTQNLSSNPREPQRHWSGPIVRNDQQTIQKNISALPRESDQNLYRAFVSAFSQPDLRMKKGHHERTGL